MARGLEQSPVHTAAAGADTLEMPALASVASSWRRKVSVGLSTLWSFSPVFQYHFNPSQSVLVMEGDDIGNINRALQKVSYINSRQFPTAGVRRLKVSSKVQ